MGTGDSESRRSASAADVAVAAADTARSRIDERALTAGTTVRFALLVILLVLSSAALLNWTLAGSGLFPVDPDGACMLAAGGDPGHDYVWASDNAAYQRCVDQHGRQPPGWLVPGWPAVVLAVAGVLFAVLPGWIRWRRRLVPLETVDHDGGIQRQLAAAAEVAGLTRLPRVVVDPARLAAGAVVFGRNRRPVVCLYGGLLARRDADPAAFRAVLLHELAHIRNGDVTLAYTTVALWRVFVALVLVPYVAAYVKVFTRSQSPAVTRGLVLAVFMVALVHLARSEVLRSREVHADLAAARWGADPHGWDVTVPPPTGGRARRALGSFAELWRTHPRWDLRREALVDPAGLFGLGALPMFLTGAAASLVANNLWFLLGPGWMTPMTVLTGATVAGVAGVAVWRAVAHAVLTGRRAPSAVRAGLWLGVGMVVAELLNSRVAVFGWLPAQPLVLVPMVLVGAVSTWWVSQCARLWLRVWSRRRLLPPMLLVLTGAGLLMAAWWDWWQSAGVFLAYGWPFDNDGLRQLLLSGAPTDGLAGQDRVLTALATVFPVLYSLISPPLARYAVLALWLVPLAAWMLRPVRRTPLWIRAALPDARLPDATPAYAAPPDAAPPDAAPAYAAPPAPPAGLPPLWRAVAVAVLAGGVSWLAVAAVMAQLHVAQPPVGQRGTAFALVYQSWVFVALLVGPVIAAIVVSVVAGDSRLVLASVAAQVALLVAFLGGFVLIASDGCLGPLGIFLTSCRWRPAVTWQGFHLVLSIASAVAALLAVAVAGTVSTAHRLWRTVSATLPAPPAAPVPRILPVPRAGPAPAEPDPGRQAIRRTGTAVLAAVVVAVTVAAGVASGDRRGTASDPAAIRQMQRPAPVPSARTAAMQVTAWYTLGGQRLLTRFTTDVQQVSAGLMDAAKAGGTVDEPRFYRLCGELGALAREADEYFPVPDRPAQQLWQAFTARVAKISRDCVTALDTDDGPLFLAAMNELTDTGTAVRPLVARLTEVRRAGGL